jgi:hypothetical protein
MYGVWDPPKTYIHLWQEGPIVLDIDTPLDFFDGKSAFNRSQAAFEIHVSQHIWGFRRWLNGSDFSITKSTQIRNYAPGKFGLYRSTVGADPEGTTDFWANITLFKDIVIPEDPIDVEPSDIEPSGNGGTGPAVSPDNGNDPSGSESGDQPEPSASDSGGAGIPTGEDGNSIPAYIYVFTAAAVVVIGLALVPVFKLGKQV